MDLEWRKATEQLQQEEEVEQEKGTYNYGTKKENNNIKI